MLQAALLDCQFLDLFPFSDDGFVAAEVDVCGCDVVHPSNRTLAMSKAAPKVNQRRC